MGGSGAALYHQCYDNLKHLNLNEECMMFERKDILHEKLRTCQLMVFISQELPIFTRYNQLVFQRRYFLAPGRHLLQYARPLFLLFKIINDSRSVTGQPPTDEPIECRHNQIR